MGANPPPTGINGGESPRAANTGRLIAAIGNSLQPHRQTHDLWRFSDTGTVIALEEASRLGGET